MKDILFTNPEFIKSVTVISDNLQDKFILSSIREAQDIEFQQVVGSRLYKKLKNLVEDESILLESMAQYRELLDKAQYYIAYQTLANLTVNSTFKINNVGVNTISDENVQTASMTDTFKLSKYYTDKADHYKMMLQNWLLKNKSKFPELLKSDISELSANVHSAASCNVFLGGARGKQIYTPSSLRDESQEESKPFTMGELVVETNGTYLPKDSDLDAFNKVTVDVQMPKISVNRLTLGITSENVDLTIFETSQVTNLYYMFSSSPNIVTLDLSTWNVSNVETMEAVFQGRRKLTNINVSGWKPSKCTIFNNIFAECSALQTLDLSGWDVTNGQTFNSMFRYCENLETINMDGWKPSNATSMTSMFEYCTNLSNIIFDFETSDSLADIGTMFDGCSKITSLDLGGWNVSNVTNMFATFNDCRSLTDLNISGWNMANVTNISRLFDNCNSLINLNLDGATFPKSDLNIGLHNSNNLTVDSLIGVLNALPQLSDGESHYVQIGSANIAKLSDIQKSIATNKGFVLQ